MKVDYVPADRLKPLEWRANYTIEPDMYLIAQSLLDHGWLAPLVARASDGTIIDGHVRWRIAQKHRRLRRRIPVVWVNCDEATAVVMHLQLNRAQGRLVAHRVSAAIGHLLDTGKWKPQRLRRALDMTDDEFDLLAGGTAIKARKIEDHEYSPAWVPVDGDDPSYVQGITIERPPTPDR